MFGTGLFARSRPAPSYFTPLLDHPGRELMHDASRPWIVVEARNAPDMLGVVVVRVVSRHSTRSAARAKLARIA